MQPFSRKIWNNTFFFETLDQAQIFYEFFPKKIFISKLKKKKFNFKGLEHNQN